MAAPTSSRRPAHTMKIVKYMITICAVVITSLGSIALNDERARAHSPEIVSMGISEQLIDGARDALSPLVSWLAEPGEEKACSQQAGALP